ncbi:oxygen-independent coproporphyrinogen III oxidase [Martelella mediterranea]|uniref:oxygen-independent coproporphyrinogen III oxidase n=1 Tax=Martelella mediterranea TaxID=293089 RepID=UPI001E41EE67|nr:oxygen-independent coproporphyrinogen III oxidase [Martelella mediterranea]MCD1636679.1 oxygen-independent coproporphyrinogen III oxidase [Martelella mediterranea]
MTSQRQLLEKFSEPVPRYTSYPTAPHFHEGVDPVTARQWITALGAGQKLSLYVHIPYCDRLCWFCACHTKHTLKYEPVAAYLESLKHEIETMGRLVSPDVIVTGLHWGGGSPTMLKPEDMHRLMGWLRSVFTFADDAEISVEMDPNDLDEARYDALAEIGVTRASLGVQDFDPKVQKTINRLQTFEQTAEVIAAMRKRGVRSVNCDLLYGLPYQTLDTMAKTVADIISLKPDRIALFGYAHVPWMKKHQVLIPEHALPDAEERFRQMSLAAGMLVEAGYEAIGIDHFALADDTLAKAARTGRLRRNFQGYTDESADALIGLGASSISQLPEGYWQNMPATGEYRRMVESGDLAVVRGVALQPEDRARAFVIERIMCAYGFSVCELKARFDAGTDDIIAEAKTYAGENPDVCVYDRFGFRLKNEAFPFARSVAAVFDTYLGRGKGRHSAAV